MCTELVISSLLVSSLVSLLCPSAADQTVHNVALQILLKLAAASPQFKTCVQALSETEKQQLETSIKLSVSQTEASKKPADSRAQPLKLDFSKYQWVYVYRCTTEITSTNKPDTSWIQHSLPPPCRHFWAGGCDVACVVLCLWVPVLHLHLWSMRTSDMAVLVLCLALFLTRVAAGETFKWGDNRIRNYPGHPCRCRGFSSRRSNHSSEHSCPLVGRLQREVSAWRNILRFQSCLELCRGL